MFVDKLDAPRGEPAAGWEAPERMWGSVPGQDSLSGGKQIQAGLGAPRGF